MDNISEIEHLANEDQKQEDNFEQEQEDEDR